MTTSSGPVPPEANPEHEQKYCDSYHASDDLTPNQKTWVEAEYEFDITSTSQFDMAMTWAIREYDASELGIGGLIDPVYELLGPSGTGLISSRDGLIGGDYDDQNDGLPADVLRHFLDTEIPSTNITVGQQLIRSVEEHHLLAEQPRDHQRRRSRLHTEHRRRWGHHDPVHDGS